MTFQFLGSGTNVQWVFAVQTEEDAAKFPAVPDHWMNIFTGFNLQMIEHPAAELTDPLVQAEKWEVTKGTCYLNPN